MIHLRPAGERGVTDWGWLDSRHTFSFGDYHDSSRAGFGALRVINEDRVAPGGGFGTHGHADMEILSYVLEGALEHRDSSGGAGVIRPGEIQFMRAGTGVRHSEFNHSRTEPVHFLQIWIVPATRGLAPAYGQRKFDDSAASRGLVLLASGDGREGSLALAQDVDLWLARVPVAGVRWLALRPGRRAWLQATRGALRVNGTRLSAGDGAGVTEEKELVLAGEEPSEVLLFDLA